MQHIAHAHRAGISQHDKAQVRGRLVVVHAVLAGAVADEGVVLAAQLAHDVAQREDGAEDELGVVGGARELLGGRAGGRRAGDGGRRRGEGGREPVFGVDAFGCGGGVGGWVSLGVGRGGGGGGLRTVPVEDVEGEDCHGGRSTSRAVLVGVEGGTGGLECWR